MTFSFVRRKQQSCFNCTIPIVEEKKNKKQQFLKKDLAFSENLVSYSEEGEYRNTCPSSCSDLHAITQGRLSV